VHRVAHLRCPRSGQAVHVLSLRVSGGEPDEPVGLYSRHDGEAANVHQLGERDAPGFEPDCHLRCRVTGGGQAEVAAEVSRQCRGKPGRPRETAVPFRQPGRGGAAFRAGTWLYEEDEAGVPRVAPEVTGPGLGEQQARLRCRGLVPSSPLRTAPKLNRGRSSHVFQVMPVVSVSSAMRSMISGQARKARNEDRTEDVGGVSWEAGRRR